MISRIKQACKDSSKNEFLNAHTKADLRLLCDADGISGVSRFNKSQLWDACCNEIPVEDIKARGKTRRVKTTPPKTRMSYAEMLAREAVEEERARKEKKDAFFSDLSTIVPANMKKIRKIDQYKFKKTRREIPLFQRIGERIASVAGETPENERVPCPKNMSDTVDQIENKTHLRVEDEPVNKDMLYKIIKEERYNDGGVLDKESHEVIVVNDGAWRTSIKDVKEDLSRSFNVDKCFEFVGSKSGDLYGIFLKR